MHGSVRGRVSWAVRDVTDLVGLVVTETAAVEQGENLPGAAG